MKRIICLATAILLAAGAAPVMAEPGGCLKYGAAGAVGGHFVHHGVLGAAGGCAAGAYKRHEYRKQQRLQAQHEPQRDNGRGNGAAEDSTGR